MGTQTLLESFLLKKVTTLINSSLTKDTEPDFNDLPTEAHGEGCSSDEESDLEILMIFRLINLEMLLLLMKSVKFSMVSWVSIAI